MQLIMPCHLNLHPPDNADHGDIAETNRRLVCWRLCHSLISVSCRTHWRVLTQQQDRLLRGKAAVQS
jgi:hypothetical protein